MPETPVQDLLRQLNTLTFGPESRLGFAWVEYEDVREQDINANVMSAEMFNALVSNVGRHAALESVPLCATRVETPDVIEIVSGHHRIRAARAAGLRGGIVLLYRGLSNSELRAKQLAHNSIAGQSDPEIVKEIWDQIGELEDRMESFIDPELFANLPTAVKFEMVDIDPLADAKTVTVVFLPTQVRDFQTALELLSSEPDHVYLAAVDAFEGFRRAVQETKAELDIVSYPTALAAMARMALERLAQIRETREGREARAREAGQPIPEREVPNVEIDPDLLAALEGV